MKPAYINCMIKRMSKISRASQRKIPTFTTQDALHQGKKHEVSLYYQKRLHSIKNVQKNVPSFIMIMMMVMIIFTYKRNGGRRYYWDLIKYRYTL